MLPVIWNDKSWMHSKNLKDYRMDKSHYQMLIQWSDEDQCYVVFLPDFPELRQPCTEGETYETAALHGRELIESLISWYLEEAKTLPQPRTLQTA